MLLGYDLTILRHPAGGTGRYAIELLRAMRASPPAPWQVVAFAGLPRVGRDGAVPAAVRRSMNLVGDLGWLVVGARLAIERHGIDVWYGPANLLPLASSRPAVVTIHDLNVVLVPDEYDRGFAVWARTMYRKAADRASAIVTPSEFVRRMVIDRFGVAPERVRAIPSGVDHLEGLREGPATDLPRPYALFVGRTEPHKNVGLLLDAWRAGVPRGLHLVVCGPPGRAHEDLRRMADQPPLRGRVHVIGPLDADRLHAAYRDAAIFLFASRAEGFGFPPLEAMHLGVPTAVADAGPLPEVTAGGALMFDPGDPLALADLVTRMMADDELRARTSRAGRDVAARYRWSETATQVWREVEHAAGHTGGAPALQRDSAER